MTGAASQRLYFAGTIQSSEVNPEALVLPTTASPLQVPSNLAGAGPADCHEQASYRVSTMRSRPNDWYDWV